MKIRPLALLGLVGLICLSAAPAPTPPAPAKLPPPGAEAPKSQVLFVTADHEAWTLMDRDAGQPVSLALTTRGLVLVGLGGGWLVLNDELQPGPHSLAYLGRSESALKAGSPWIAGWTDGTAVLVDNAGKQLGLLYPEESLALFQPLNLPDLTHFNAVPGRKLSFFQSRKTWAMDIWPREPYPDTPLNFFPGEIKTGPDNQPWGLDLIGGRIWAVEDGFWTPQAEATSPTKPLTMAGGLRGIFFLAGSGWLGSFDSEGQRLWLWDKDLAGSPLPPDPKLVSGPKGLYLLSASQKRLWFFSWTKLSAPAKRMTPPAASQVFQWIDDRTGWLTDRLHYPEAEALTNFGLAYAERVLQRDPFNQEIRATASHLKALRQDLRSARVGFGSLDLRWDLHTGAPWADWEFKADQSAAAGSLWVKTSVQWQPQPTTAPIIKEGPLARSARQVGWPGVPELKFSKTWFPAVVEVLLIHPDSGQRGWQRFILPWPTLPDPPDERPQVPGMPSRGSPLGGQ